MFFVRLLSETVKLVTNHDSPVLLVPISLGFQEALALQGLRLIVIILAESLQRLDFGLVISLGGALTLNLRPLPQEALRCCLVELLGVVGLKVKVDTLRLHQGRCILVRALSV